MDGEETELDRSLIESLHDPLIHIIRNSCDHGIETPEERDKKAKPGEGDTLTQGIQRRQQRDHRDISMTERASMSKP